MISRSRASSSILFGTAFRNTRWRSDCLTPKKLFWDLDNRISERKERLLAAAFCRRISHLMSEDRCRRLLGMARYFGGLRADPTPVQSGLLIRLLDGIESRADGAAAPADLDEDRELADVLSGVTDDYYACYDESWGPTDTNLFATCDAASQASGFPSSTWTFGLDRIGAEWAITSVAMK